MKVICQLGIIFSICLAGEGISAALPFTCPSGIVSMLLLFFLLACGLLKEEKIKEAGDFLLDNMAFFYIPVSVGMLEYFDIIRQHVIKILLICLLSFVLTLLSSYYTVIFVRRLMKGGTDSC
ncbi:MAG: CidA/LrgA family protein [Coprococcus sp.]|nr:CidA/LrgA family protein [Coprococcus sp.]